MNKCKEIKFNPSDEDADLAIEAPCPAQKIVPEWYKKSPNFDSKKIEVDENFETKNLVLKQCMPFFDSLCSGYVQKTWCDLYVSFQNNELKITPSNNFIKIIDFREKSYLEIDESYYPTEFTWMSPWFPETPPGYSTLFVSPLNRMDLPFTTCSAIIDTDQFKGSSWGRVPFYLKKNFQGKIPKGTPMYQMIPFKREDWNSEICQYSSSKSRKITFDIKSYFYGYYKKNMWKRKSFK